MKLAFVKKLTELAEKDSRIILLTGDLGFQIFDDFQNRFGQRYVNVGVAEAQLVNAAAGLALIGWKPVTYSIASFMTSRCFEQIKLSVAYHNLPVVIVGAGGGFAYGESGVTHHSAEDIALMSLLPKMNVIAPGDANEVEQLLPQILEFPGPSYLRIGRGKEPQYDAESPAILGRARLLSDGQDVAIISTGEVASEVVSALKMLSYKDCYPIAFQFHTIKPLDIETLEKLSSKVKVVFVVEEHTSSGGLGSAIRDWALEKDNLRMRIKTLSIANEFVLGSPSQHEVRARYKIDAEAIATVVEKSLGITR